MEMHKGLPTLTCLKELNREIVSQKKKIEKCTNKNHPDYECTVTEYSDGQVEVTECPECQKESEIAYQRMIDRQYREENIKHCQNCNVEPEYYDKTLADYEPKNQTQEKALKASEEILEGKLKKLVLLGSYGTGKTMLGSILAKEKNGKIYSMYEISTMIRQSYTVKADKTELEIVKELASVPFLAIDEVGRTNGSSSEKNWLSYILDKRHVRGLPFVLISNGHLRENCPNNGCEKCFENYMDGDVISRLRQNSKIINILGDDYRACK